MHPLFSGGLALTNMLAWEHFGTGGWLGGLAFVLLAITPGAWISFGLPLKGISFWARLCIAIALSPFIACLEFYAVRLLGLPFPSTAVLLVFLNLPAAYLILKRRARLAEVPRGNWLMLAITVLLPFVFTGSVLTHMDARIYSGHSWLHADAAYMLVRGDLDLEAPTLAGVRSSYPVWPVLAFEALHSYLTNSPPMSSYIWSDLIWLIAVCGFVAGIVKELGGGRLAQATSAIFLLVGTNPVGYVLMQLVPIRGDTAHDLWGDLRLMPWVIKFMLFSPMALGLAMIAAMIYLLVRPGLLAWDVLVILALLVCGVGLIYPLLFPPACAILCARALAVIAVREGWARTNIAREVLALAGMVLLACLLTYLEVRFLTAARHTSTGEVAFAKLPSVIRKLIAAVICTSVLLAGVALSIRPLWKLQRRSMVILLSAAGASLLLYCVFFLPYFENEYKFVFTMAMCLAPFPAIAVERIWQEWPRARAIPALVLVAILLLGPYGHWAYRTWPAPWARSLFNAQYSLRYDLPLDASGFFLRLNKQDPRYGICDAVRGMTPVRSVLLVDNSDIYYPVLTGRSLYVSAQDRELPGVNLHDEDLEANVRGYGPQILADRRAILAEFFNAGDSSLRQQALRAVQALQRPVAVIADQAHPDLLNWLKADKAASELYTENGMSLWLIDETGSPR
jgi:hypothetical protein